MAVEVRGSRVSNPGLSGDAEHGRSESLIYNQVFASMNTPGYLSIYRYADLLLYFYQESQKKNHGTFFISCCFNLLCFNW